MISIILSFQHLFLSAKYQQMIQILTPPYNLSSLHYQQMFCCFTGNNNKPEGPQRELAVNLKNKKPEDFMKDPIPLNLSETIGFQLGKDKKWTVQIALSERVSKREDPESDRKNLDENVSRLRASEKRQKELEGQIIEKQREDEQTRLKLAQAELKSKAVEYMVANQTRDIYRYQEKVRLHQS